MIWILRPLWKEAEQDERPIVECRVVFGTAIERMENTAAAYAKNAQNPESTWKGQLPTSDYVMRVWEASGAHFQADLSGGNHGAAVERR